MWKRLGMLEVAACSLAQADSTLTLGLSGIEMGLSAMEAKLARWAGEIEGRCDTLEGREQTAFDRIEGLYQAMVRIEEQVRALRGELARVSLDRDLYDRVLGLQQRLDDLEQRLSVGYAGPGEGEDACEQLSPVDRLVTAREGVLREVCSLFGRAAVGVYGNRQLALLRPLVRAWDAYAAALGGFRRG